MASAIESEALKAKFRAGNDLSPYFLTYTNSPCFPTTDQKSLDIQIKACEVPFLQDFSLKNSVLYKLSLNFVATTFQYLKPIHYALAKFPEKQCFPWPAIL